MHLYDRQGMPVYEVPYADPSKGKRSSTLRDARKLGLVPSVTEVLNVKAKPGLIVWKENQILDAGYSIGHCDFEGNTISKDIWQSEVKALAGEKAKIARDEGSNIHDAIESAFKGRVISPQYRNTAIKVRDYVYDTYGADGWNAEQSFAHPMGYGGKIDLNNPEKGIVFDFKTKEEIIPGKRLAWDEHIMQLTAYSTGLWRGTLPEEHTHINIFVSWDGDIVESVWEDVEEVKRGWEMFKLCFQLFCLDKKFDPSF